ncbi:hypothetical protein COLO4_25696 [Corchorus olitorius]|uniref:Arginyl-tRNA--protein transferase n=1 Tax=Corchorus olitorius TaxID=93759 RepID=A0A1R3I0C4_9ROSI|nr:hypothetical protein COLO4_25696 [Corchorus olitorius]
MKNEASSSNSREESVVADCGRRRSSCGYCKSSGRTSISHGLWAHSVTVHDYQDGMLEERKPIELAISSSAAEDSPSCGKKEENKAEEFMRHLSDQIDKVVLTYIESGEFPSGIQMPKASVKKVLPAKCKLSVEGSEDLLYSSNIAFQIAAALRRKQSTDMDVQQSRKSRHSAAENDLCPKSVAEKLVSSLNQLANISRLSIRACNGHINFYSAGKSTCSDGDVQIVALPEESGSGSKSSSAKKHKSSEHPQAKKRKLEIRLKRSSFDPEEYELYRRYQIKVHNDTPDRVTESSYRRFLVDTPLLFVSPSADGMVPPCGFGSFHQQYIIDGKLVAVGVIDILPKCLSTRPLLDKKKYVVLSDFASLQDGESSQSCIPENVMELQHDNIGVDDSNDVRMDDNEEMIDIESDSSDDELDPETSSMESSAIDVGDLTNVLIGLRGSRLRYKDLQRAFGPTERNYLEAQLHSYQRVVGPELSERMVYLLG